jgi:hypothetical protein
MTSPTGWTSSTTTIVTATTAEPGREAPSIGASRRYRDVLGARVVFAIEAMGTRVAEVSISPQGPRLVLADHLAGDAPLLLHRVSASTRRSRNSALAGCAWKAEWSCRWARRT